MFRVKICGMTRPEDAGIAARAGADAIGLNFYAGSSRRLDTAHAQAIAGGLPDHVARVGVFVNASAEEIEKTARQIALDWIQLHGDEPPKMLTLLPERKIIKAFRFGIGGADAVSTYLARCGDLGRLPDAVLIDALVAGVYGGTGRTAPWEELVGARETFFGLPLILAGGLTAENVCQAIDQVRPDAVDTASGVEHEPGIKDADLVTRFVRRARASFGGMKPADS